MQAQAQRVHAVYSTYLRWTPHPVIVTRRDNRDYNSAGQAFYLGYHSAIYPSANAYDCAASAHKTGCWSYSHVLHMWTVGLNSIWLLGCVHLVPELGVPGGRSSYSVAQMSYLRFASARLLRRQNCGRLRRRLHSLDRDSASSARAGRTSSNTSCWSSFRIQR